jgi:hypothetical protein
MKRAIKDNTTNSKSYKDKSAFNHDYPEQSADGALGDGGTSRVAFKTRTGLVITSQACFFYLNICNLA